MAEGNGNGFIIQDPEQEMLAQNAQIDIMSDALLNVADAKAESAGIEAAFMTQTATPAVVSDSVNAVLIDLIGVQNQVVGRFPAGSQVVKTFGSTKIVVDPVTRDLIVTEPNPEYKTALLRARQDDNAVARDTVGYAPPQGQINLQEEFGKLSKLRGEELLMAHASLARNINVAMAKEAQLIRDNAERRAGLYEAEAAYNAQLQRVQSSQGVIISQSGQARLREGLTVAAAALENSRKRSEEFFKASVSTSSRAAELESLQQTLVKTMEFKGRKEILADQREEAATANAVRKKEEIEFRYNQMGDLERKKHLWRQDSEEAKGLEKQITNMQKKLFGMGISDPGRAATILRESGSNETNVTDPRNQEVLRYQNLVETHRALMRTSVPSNQLLNFRILNGSANPDEDLDRAIVMQRRDKDKILSDLLLADKSNIMDFIVSPDSKVRNSALKLLDGWDKLANSKITVDDLKSLPPGPIVKVINDTLGGASSPTALVKLARDNKIVDEDGARTLLPSLLQGSKEQVQQTTANILKAILQSKINKLAESNILDDVTKWKTSETSQGTPLGEVINGIKTPEGTIPMDVFIQKTFSSDIRHGTENRMLNEKEKQDLVFAAIRVATQTTPTSALFPASNALSDKLIGYAAGVMKQTRAARGMAEYQNMMYSRKDPFGIPSGATGSFEPGAGATGRF